MISPAKLCRYAPSLILGGLLITAGLWAGCTQAPAKTAAPAAKTANAASTNKTGVATTNSDAAYVSVFEELPLSTGRDPFFPDSHRRETAVTPAATTPSAPAAPVNAELILKGIVKTASLSQAVINNCIMEKGEEDSVRLPTGKTRVKCLEIGADFVMVQVAGESNPRRLTMEQRR